MIADCTEAITLRPDYAKAYSRRAQAYESIGKLRQAMVDHMTIAFSSNFQDEAADTVGLCAFFFFIYILSPLVAALKKKALGRILKEAAKQELQTFIANREKRLPSGYQIKTFIDGFDVRFGGLLLIF